MVVPLEFTWRHLLFAHWRADQERLAGRLPEALELDTYEDEAWLSLVVYRNERTRPRGFPAWMGMDSPGVNVRTYVRDGADEGVFFFDIDAGHPLTVIGGRLLHFLPFHQARASLTVEDDRVHFASRRLAPGGDPARLEVTYRPTGETDTPEPGSRAAFLTDRHRQFTTGPGGIRSTDVHHPPWRLSPAEATFIENSLVDGRWGIAPDAEPVLYYSPGTHTVAAPNRRRSSH